MAEDFLLEICTEELPAGVIPKALGALSGMLEKRLEGARLSFSALKTLGTPRRLALIVEGLDHRQPDVTTEVRGPKKSVAYDEDGKPTKALIGFARGQGVDLADIKVVKSGKGEHVQAVKSIKGEDTLKILPGILEGLLTQEVFAKSMRWGSHDISYARPVHSLLALYGKKIVPFAFGHIKSSNTTFGHRFHGPGKVLGKKPVKVASASEYEKTLKKAYVIADSGERRSIIEEGLKSEAAAAGGEVLSDPALLEEVTYLVEYPVVLKGSFAPEFLKLPAPVVINAMREHQRYFSVVDKSGVLMAHFMTVANTRAADMAVVIKGNERVLRARLNDAKFYFDRDRAVELARMTERLKGVIFQKRLGTSYEKVERFTRLALFIGERAGYSEALKEDESPVDFLTESFNPAQFDAAKVDPRLYAKFVIGRASMLAKADLTSGVVGEFPKLQGVMGGIYAERCKEAPPVAAAIREHYQPIASGGELPVTRAGAVISMADKLDTIVGCFSVGLIPTGAQDPYALRRQALGVLAILGSSGLAVSLDEMVECSAGLLSDKVKKGDPEEVKGLVLEFFRERFKNQLLARKLSFDSIDSVLSAPAAPWYDIADAERRIRAIEAFKGHPACANLVIAFKRVSNILKGFDLGEGGPDAALLKEKDEKALHELSVEIGPVINAAWGKGDYKAVFETLASIKVTIDAFFDNVMVMVDDPAIRDNRLLLLNTVRNLYFKIADLSRLAL